MKKITKKYKEFGDLIKYQMTTVVSAIAVIALCVSVLVARYVWHVEIIEISKWAGPISMATNSALCFILLAIGQITHICGSIKRRERNNAA